VGNQLHTLLHYPHSSLISQPVITALPAPFADLTSTPGSPTPHFNRELFTRIVMGRMVFFGHVMQACLEYAMYLCCFGYAMHLCFRTRLSSAVSGHVFFGDPSLGTLVSSLVHARKVTCHVARMCYEVMCHAGGMR